MSRKIRAKELTKMELSHCTVDDLRELKLHAHRHMDSHSLNAAVVERYQKLCEALALLDAVAELNKAVAKEVPSCRW